MPRVSPPMFTRFPIRVVVWRLRIPEGTERFEDRWPGPQTQDVAHEVGDVAVRRADLLSSTARQRVLG